MLAAQTNRRKVLTRESQNMRGEQAAASPARVSTRFGELSGAGRAEDAVTPCCPSFFRIRPGRQTLRLVTQYHVTSAPIACEIAVFFLLEKSLSVGRSLSLLTTIVPIRTYTNV